MKKLSLLGIFIAFFIISCGPIPPKDGGTNGDDTTNTPSSLATKEETALAYKIAMLPLLHTQEEIQVDIDSGDFEAPVDTEMKYIYKITDANGEVILQTTIAPKNDSFTYKSVGDPGNVWGHSFGQVEIDITVTGLSYEDFFLDPKDQEAVITGYVKTPQRSDIVGVEFRDLRYNRKYQTFSDGAFWITKKDKRIVSADHNFINENMWKRPTRKATDEEATYAFSAFWSLLVDPARKTAIPKGKQDNTVIPINKEYSGSGHITLNQSDDTGGSEDEFVYFLEGDSINARHKEEAPPVEYGKVDGFIYGEGITYYNFSRPDDTDKKIVFSGVFLFNNETISIHDITGDRYKEENNIISWWQDGDMWYTMESGEVVLIDIAIIRSTWDTIK